jgi:hypothetical protein
MKIHFGWSRKNKLNPLSISIEECLTKSEADRLKQQDIERIMAMTRQERLKFFTSLIGEQKANFVNGRFENDLLPPQQKTGLMNWINNTKDVEPKWRKEIIREISGLDTALDEKEMDAFMRKLAKLKLGAGVTFEETKMIYDLTAAANAAMKKLDAGASMAEFQKAKKALDDHVASLMPPSD